MTSLNGLQSKTKYFLPLADVAVCFFKKTSKLTQQNLHIQPPNKSQHISVALNFNVSVSH